MKMEVEMRGFKELEKSLLQLETKVAKKVVRQALRAGGKILLKAVKQKVPVDTGELKKNIKVKAGKRKKGQASIFVGTSEKNYSGPYFYASFVEYGHLQGSRNIAKANREFVAARPYMRPSFDLTKKAVEKEITTKLLEGINREATIKPTTN